MPILKKVVHSDLLLLRDLFCEGEKQTLIYDPLHCVSGEITSPYTDKQIIQDAEGGPEIIFNFSMETLPDSIKADYIFHFNLRIRDQRDLYYYITNTDGSIRWIFPASSRAPYFLELYNSGTFRARIYKFLVKVAYTGGLKEQVVSGSFFLQQKSKNKVQRITSGDGEEGFSIFTGTKGANRKAIISLHNRQNATHFIKMAFDDSPKELIINELNMLTTLSKYDFTALSLPQTSFAIDPSFVKMTNVKPGAIISANRLRDVHIRALAELYQRNHEHRKIRDTPAWQTICNQLNLLDKEHEIHNELEATLVYGIIQKLFNLFNSIETQIEIPVSFAHGDFTPWNMYTDDQRLYVYDWELAGAGMPMLLDLFHFIFQSQVLLFRKDYSYISKGIREALDNQLTQEIINKYKIDTALHYRLYLLFNISYYIRLYMQQKPLHMQAHWLVNTWEHALNDI